MSDALSPNLAKAIAGEYTLPIKEILHEAWHKVHGVKKPFWGAIGWVVLIFLGLGMLEGIIVTIAAMHAFNHVVQVSNIIGLIVQTFLSGLFYLSVIFLLINHIAGKAVSARMIFVFWDSLGKLLAILACYMLICWLLNLVLILAIEFAYINVSHLIVSISLFLLGAIMLFTVLGIGIVFNMSSLLILEKKLSVGLAILIAFKAVFRCFFKNICLVSVAGIAFLLSAILTLGIGLIWLLPAIFNVTAIQYRQIFGIEAIEQN